MPIVSTAVMLDKERHLRFTMRAVIDLSEKHGADLDKCLESLVREGAPIHETLKNLSLILWAGLVHEDPELTPEKLTDIVDFGMLAALVPIVQQSAQSAVDPGDPEKK